MKTDLTIRTRVALWYGLLVLAVVLIVGAAVLVVYSRTALVRLDRELDADMRTVDGVVMNELEEQMDLPDAAVGALRELDLPGVGVAILDSAGAVLATRASGVTTLSPARLRLAPADNTPTTIAADDVRLGTSRWRHGAAAYTIAAWMPLAPLADERATLMDTLLVSLPIALAGAILGGWLIARWALRPLTTMAEAATAFDHRRLDDRLPVMHAGDELGRLSIAFNAVLDRLSRLVHAQRQFMADASHELRTPVSIARTAAQVTLGVPSRSESEYRESLAIVAEELQRVTRLVDDMFLLALADLQARPLDRRHFYLNEIVSDCVRAARVLATAKAVTIHTRGEDDDVATRGDEALTRQTIMNLLDNAIRHAPAGGDVTVSLRTGADSTELAIEDSGPGIPPAFHSRVFERFVRLDNGGAGAGLGLAIAKWVAEQHGWRLRVDGDGGRSSRFVLTVSLQREYQHVE